MELLVVGDALLDVTVAAGGAMLSGSDTAAAIRVGAGGQGANVAVRLARRGRSVALVAPVGDDEAGRLVAAALREEGVELRGLAAPRTGAVLVLLAPDGERTMLSDREPLPVEAAAAIEVALSEARWVHCSGYVLRDPRSPEVAALLEAREAGLRLSVAGGSLPTAEAPDYARALDVARPDLLLVSRAEAVALGAPSGEPDAPPRAAADHLARRFACLAVVTAGASGASAALPERLMLDAAAPSVDRPLDATGAGDAFAAALLASLHDVAWPPEESRLVGALSAASRAGAQAVEVRGAQGRIPDEGALSAGAAR